MTAICTRGSGCSNKGKAYVHIKLSIVITPQLESQLIALDGKVNSISQCPLVIRKSLDEKEAIIELCRPAMITEQELSFVSGDVDIWTASQARAYIIANTTNWDRPE